MRKAILKPSAVACLALVLAPQAAQACATCYGASDSELAEGMNWGIFSLLFVVVIVLSGIGSFFVYLARRSATLGTPESPGNAADSSGAEVPRPAEMSK